MSKYSIEEWLTVKSKKKIRHLTKKNKLKKRRIRKKLKANISKNNHINNKFINKNVKELTLPEIFSITKNTEETVLFFNYLIELIEEKRIGRIFKFNMSDVKYISIDAIMYLLAIIRNVKLNKIYKNTFMGNVPTNKAANDTLAKSGFYKYVTSKNIDIIPKSNCVYIRTGNTNDSALASQICDFTNREINISFEQTRALYQTLIELMSNTYHHAYNKSKGSIVIDPVWYVYAEKVKNKVKFTFLDTGVGIAKTIFMKTSERFINLFSKNEDSNVLSAFAGKFRSETGKPNQGTGLPEIYGYCKNNRFSRFTVITNSSCCKILNNKDDSHMINSVLNGTVYFWEIEEKECTQ